ncbi:MAG: sigma-70 family RNA polymerase sigma factor [Planctomycetes bacterium]|nr:sigma-70 family RNA polymerase sigma factor [Planctomycetota bacterium]
MKPNRIPPTRGVRSRPTDSELAAAALDGCNDAFRVLVERHQKGAFWLARGMLRNDDDARDVSQEAFIRVHRSLVKFDPKLRFKSWLNRIVVNLCIDSLRSRRCRVAVDLSSIGEPRDPRATPDRLEEEELKERVAQILDQLPDRYKTIMVLRDLQGVCAKRIGEITNTSHATVRWRHHRARQLFREAWERTYGKEPTLSLAGLALPLGEKVLQIGRCVRVDSRSKEVDHPW